MKENCLYTRGGGGRGKLNITKKRSTDRKYIITLVESVVTNTLKIKKSLRVILRTTPDWTLIQTFNFKELDIG